MRDDAKRVDSVPAVKYSIRPADLVRDRETVLALWQQGFPSTAHHPVKYDWCYGATPQGKGRLYLLQSSEGGDVIGVQGIVPRRWWVGGKTTPTGICADLVVDQRHRSIGPALALVRQVVEREQRGDDARLLYGFPNLKSEALYRRAGYTKKGIITRYARPLRLQVWLSRKGLPAPLAVVLGKIADLAFEGWLLLNKRRMSRRWRCVPATQFDERFDAFWSRVSARVGPMVIRDRAYLEWRFGNNFAGKTQIMLLLTHDGRMDGYIVYVVNPDNQLTVLDFLADDHDAALSALFNLFLRRMYQEGYTGVMLEYSGPAAVENRLRQCGFSPRETNSIYAMLGQGAIGWREDNLPYFTGSDRDQ